MAHIFTKLTIAEINADQNLSKIVHENNFNLVNMNFGGKSKAETEALRLKGAEQTRRVQALEHANVCNLTDAQNTKRELDECTGRAERAEEANRCNLADAQNAKWALEEREQIIAESKRRVNRERMLFAALVAVFVIHVLAPRTGLVLFIPWLAGACVVYMPHLWQRASGLGWFAYSREKA
jgi:hypothetical protein